MNVLAFIVEGTPVAVPDDFYRDGGIKRVEYRVTYDQSRKRVWMCECPHNTYRKAECKHIVQCKPELRRHQEMLSWWRGLISAELSPEDRLELLEG